MVNREMLKEMIHVEEFLFFPYDEDDQNNEEFLRSKNLYKVLFLVAYNQHLVQVLDDLDFQVDHLRHEFHLDSIVNDR